MARSGTDLFRDAIRDAALSYHDMGFNVIPVSITSKTPLIPWQRYHTERQDRETVETWCNMGVPTESGDIVEVFNLGIVTGAVSDLVVVDADNPQAVSYCRVNGLDSALTVKTTRGRHFYWRHSGQPTMNKVGGVGLDWPKVSGLDLRADGGYVLAPPSIKVNEKMAAVHTYDWEGRELPEVANTIGRLPRFNYFQKRSTPASEESFSFDDMDLTGVVHNAVRKTTARERARQLVNQFGRKLQDGDGRNILLATYCGERVKAGVVGEDLEGDCRDFMDEFFAVPLAEREFKTTIQSVTRADERNHPERHLEISLGGKEEGKGEEEESDTVAEPDGFIRLITPMDTDALMAKVAADKFYIDPFIAPGRITQVVGYNGHGKSLLTYAMCWLASKGNSFGNNNGFHVAKPTRVLYFDENPMSVLLDRNVEFIRSFGLTSGLYVMNAGVRDHLGGNPNDHDINLKTKDGLKKLERLIGQVEPEIVVFDTIRALFPGMEEQKADQWSMVNMVLKALRNHGCAVVFLHHRNKPNEMGIGRESGSTAQMTDVDTQVYITKVCEYEQHAKRVAGIANDDTEVVTLGGASMTAWEYLREQVKRVTPGERYDLGMVMEITYGKSRSVSANAEAHPQYFGFAKRMEDNKSVLVSTLTPRAKAMLAANAGHSSSRIAYELMIPKEVIESWLP